MSQASQPSQPNNQSSSKADDFAIAGSSFLQRAVYDSNSLRLTLYFKSGEERVYLYVFPAVYEAFKQAPSKGRFFATQIKGKTQSLSTKKPLMPSDFKALKPFKNILKQKKG